jgi:hypothetical protein
MLGVHESQVWRQPGPPPAFEGTTGHCSGAANELTTNINSSRSGEITPTSAKVYFKPSLHITLHHRSHSFIFLCFLTTLFKMFLIDSVNQGVVGKALFFFKGHLSMLFLVWFLQNLKFIVRNSSLRLSMVCHAS